MLDFYGTFRGKCKECSCIEYVTENNSIKCAYCDHSPSKHEIKPESSSNETCDEEAVFQNVSVSPVSVPTDIDLPSTSFCETQRDKIENSIEEPVAEKFDVSEHYKIVGESKICTNIFKEDHDLNNSLFTLSDVVINNKSYRAGDFILKQEEKITILFIEEIVLKSGKISFVLSVTLDLQISLHDGDRAATPGKQTMKEILFSKFKLPTFSSQVMPYLNGDDLGGTERKTIFNLLVNEIIYYLDNENLLMSSNRNVQGIGYSQLQNKLLETYPKMLKEPHNLLRKHRSKGPLSVLTTTISDRRRKRRERLRRSNYNFDLSKEEILEILKLVQEVELIMKKNISDMCECLKTLCRKLKKELSMNHLMDIVQYLGPDSDCLFIKEYSSLEDIPNSIY
ncbi:Translocation protein SEC62, partial [Armadillidium vulgare]